MDILTGDDLKIDRKGGLYSQWGMELVGYTVLGDASSLITVLNIPERRNLRVHVHVFNNGTSPLDPRLTFNNDGGANYGLTSMDFITSPVAQAGSSSVSNLALGPAFNNAEGIESIIDVANYKTKVKLGHFTTTDEDATSGSGRPQGRTALFKWDNTGNYITRIDVTDGVTSRAYETSSAVFVYSVPTG